MVMKNTKTVVIRRNTKTTMIKRNNKPWYLKGTPRSQWGKLKPRWLRKTICTHKFSKLAQMLSEWDDFTPITNNFQTLN